MRLFVCINVKHNEADCHHLPYSSRCLPCRERARQESQQREAERKYLEVIDREA